MGTKNIKRKRHTYKKKHSKKGGTKKIRTVYSPSFLNEGKMLDNTFVFDDKKGEKGQDEGVLCTFRKYLNDIYYDVEEYLAAIDANKEEKEKHGNIKLHGYDIIRA